MSILSIDLHSLKTMIKLSFHFQNATYELRDDINFSKFSTGCKLDVGCSAMLLPTEECFAQEVPEPVYDGLTCPNYALWDSNSGSWLAKEQKSRLRFGGRGCCS
jgi:hypothetical protein